MAENNEDALTDHYANFLSDIYQYGSPSNMANLTMLTSADVVDESNIASPIADNSDRDRRLGSELTEWQRAIPNLAEKFYSNEQFIELVVPRHDHRAAMESIMTKPDQPNSKPTLFAKAQTPVQFGFHKINQKSADKFTVRITLNCGTLKVNELIACEDHRNKEKHKKLPIELRSKGFFVIQNTTTNEVVSVDNQSSFDVSAADIEGNKADRLFRKSVIGCLRKTHKGSTTQNINPRSDLELVIETEAYGGQTCLSKHSYSLPLRLLANPGRDCPEVSLKRAGKAFTCEQTDKVGQLISEVLNPKQDIISQFNNENFTEFRQEMTQRLHNMIEVEAQLFLGRKKQRLTPGLH